jgi:predicted amidohydrolase
MSTSTLAVSQMTATDDIDENVRACARLCAQAVKAGATLLVLPECFAFLGRGDGDLLATMQPLEGPLFARFRRLAVEHGLELCFGGFPERHTDTHAWNSHVVVGVDGVVRSVYRKIHLYDVALPSLTLRESAATSPGHEVVIDDSAVGRLGLTVCYDLRFPELYRILAARGAEVLLVPAAFTLTTGKEHWEVLLRARAIENQCYVAAAAQTGRHNEKRESYGHAMIVDPWGTVVAQCRDGEGIAVAHIDRAFLEAIRARVPVWQHRRPDLYGGPESPASSSSSS